MTPTTQTHATCVALDGNSVLLRGPSGSGKSDLALRLIDAGWQLVADDRVDLASENGNVMASAPSELSGMIEARGIGILDMGAVTRAPVCLVCELVSPGAVERMPEPATTDILGHAVPCTAITPFETSAVIKVQLALKVALGVIMLRHEPN